MTHPHRADRHGDGAKSSTGTPGGNSLFAPPVSLATSTHFTSEGPSTPWSPGGSAGEEDGKCNGGLQTQTLSSLAIDELSYL
jgi:hypothetical protein